jgi:predicted TIM-barrel fold metal-dependent hydrolase
MPVIDAHVHLYPPELNAAPEAWAAAQREPHWAALCTRRRRDGRPVQGFPDVDTLLRELDRAGIDRAVLLGWYWENPSTCAWQNRFFGACVRAHPDRLDAFATLHPGAGSEATRTELRRARDEGLAGLGELSPHSQHFAIDDPVFSLALELAGQWRMPVNLHVTDPAGRSYPGRVETPREDFGQLARRFPATTFILAHWGGLWPLAAEAGDAVPPANVYYDTAASPLLYDAGVWARVLPRVGADRVLFGSDYPLDLYPRAAERDGLARFVAEARSGGADGGVMGENAARLLRGRG